MAWWSVIIPVVPDLIRAASNFVKAVKKESKEEFSGEPSSLAETAERMRALQDEMSRQADLILKMSRQLELLSQGLKALAVRAVVAIFLSVIAIGLSIFVLWKIHS